MRIVALVKSRDHVCCRYRLSGFRSCLEGAGHRFEICPWSSGWFLQQLLPSAADAVDVLIVQRRLFPAWQLNLLRRAARRLIFDFDDSIFLHSSYDSRGRASPRRSYQFKQMMHAADIVIAGNQFLREQALAFAKPHKVHEIPTCVEVGRYGLARHERDEGVQLVWIGSASTLRGLERIRGVLDGLSVVVPGLSLKVICDRSLELQHLPVRFCPWAEATESRELAGSDIGICWMPDDAWSEGKCGLKVLQYMAAGLPVVANPVGVHKKMVRHGETGFLVETPDEWQQAIGWLARDPELRRAMGRAGRRLVEEEYEVANGAAGWERVLRSFTAPVAAKDG